MSADHEMLKLAAKASGYEVRGVSVGGKFLLQHPANDALRIYVPTPWDPLQDDTDAFRLTVKLGLMVDTSCQPTLILCAGPCGIGLEESARSDPYAATRRAIVRAAAEIGKAMP